MKTKKYVTQHKTIFSIVAIFCLLIVLILVSVVPIGYKHVTVPTDAAFNGTAEAKRTLAHQCPPVSQPAIKLNYHDPVERNIYNKPVISTICPTYSYTYLLYW